MPARLVLTDLNFFHFLPCFFRTAILTLPLGATFTARPSLRPLFGVMLSLRWTETDLAELLADQASPP